LIAAALVCAAPQMAAPQSKGADAKAAAEKAKQDARIRAAMLRYGGYDFGGGIQVYVNGYHVSLTVNASRFTQACNGDGSLTAYLGPEEIALIVDTFMQAAKKQQQERARGLEHLARTLGAYQLPDDKLSETPAPPSADAKAPMTPIPSKALAAKK
jgi:hypothetical protein